MRMYALHTYKPDAHQTHLLLYQKLTMFVLHTKNIYAVIIKTNYIHEVLEDKTDYIQVFRRITYKLVATNLLGGISRKSKG